ncbi:MAG: TolC family protein [Bacteroidales bacterium]|nr:TolC family protein [Bacteroidales bacterium]
MKRKALILILLLGYTAPTLFSQKFITLKECYEKAMAVNALAGEKDAYSSISRIKDENLSKGWLPTLDANATANYNSDVVDFSKAMSAIPGVASILTPMPHDQYKFTLDINQVIYDGGAIKSGRAMEKAELNYNEKQTETDLYKLRAQINTYYFTAMILSRQKELLKNYLDLIQKRIANMQSGIDNGVILKSDADVLTSEKIRLEQQITENELRKTSLLKILSDLTGMVIDNDTEFALPEQPGEMTAELIRPELQLFDLRNEQLTAGLKLAQSKRMPKAFGFASLGYGNPPGQDFFTDNFDTYYIVGGGIKWNIFDWNRVKNEKKVIAIQQGILENRKKDLEDNLTRQLDSKSAEISSLKVLVETDSELIALRKRITASAESQYENGTITATEYLNEMNSQHQAEINFEIHKINLAMARIEYMNISGKEIE